MFFPVAFLSSCLLSLLFLHQTQILIFLQGLNNFQILILSLVSVIFPDYLGIFFPHKHLASQVNQLCWTSKLHDLSTLKCFLLVSFTFYFVTSVHLSSAKFFKTGSDPITKPEKAKVYQSHRITAHPKYEGTFKDYGVQLQAPHRITQKSNHMYESVDQTLELHQAGCHDPLAPRLLWRACSRAQPPFKWRISFPDIQPIPRGNCMPWVTGLCLLLLFSFLQREEINVCPSTKSRTGIKPTTLALLTPHSYQLS